ncbi:DUF6503 family protein [Psychroserpens ponticola]|uniref:DUF6503 family protein n=1 Tax=Psychroserpens ponticola TaxID=2932268 RepID=A0ABY7RXX9_9FLAO|nr:DUF6503 family protein [Psychroserpens ponticola]WCO01959.1 DUF6503 family protein [Psychroserpens ponticola]
MKPLTFLFVFIFSFHYLTAQTISGSSLLEKAIEYHDPNKQWSTFKAEFDIEMEMPKNSKRISHVTINLPTEFFKVKATKDTIVTEYTVDKGMCTISLNGKTDLSKAELFSNNLSCDRANMYKNYYTYLYGLPMKLKDEGTNISETVERKTFKGKSYLVLKVTYDKTVGSDVWYFYFNPETFAMEIYQFFKTDEKGNLKPDSGEYIMLSDTETINQIKIPKVRAWYYNKDDAYLATDILKN